MCYRELTYRLFVWIPILALKEFLASHLAISKLMWTPPLFKIGFSRKIPLHKSIALSIQGGSFEIIISLLKISRNFWSQLHFQSEFQNSGEICFFINRNSWKVLKPSGWLLTSLNLSYLQKRMAVDFWLEKLTTSPNELFDSLFDLRQKQYLIQKVH